MSENHKNLVEANDVNKEYYSDKPSGEISFTCEDNNHIFVIEYDVSLDNYLKLGWYSTSRTTAEIRSVSPNIHAIARAVDEKENTTNSLDNVKDTKYQNFTSSSCSLLIGDIAIWQNAKGSCLLTKLVDVQNRGFGDKVDMVKFTYKLLDYLESGRRVPKVRILPEKV